MAICRGCGGVLGRDCWHEIDCMMITRSMENERQYHEYLQERTLCQRLRDWIKHLISRMKVDETDIPF